VIKKVRIGAHEFDIIPNPLLKASDGALGVTNAAALKIEYIPHPKQSVNREVIVHEIFHAIYWAQGLVSDEDREKEEAVISGIVPILLDTLDRNPALRRLVLGE
jgi:hypothetical protein